MCVVHICRYASPTINLVYPFIQKLFTETQEYIAFKIFIIYIASGIDGEDFLEFELHEISQLIPRFKIRKRFLSAWSEITNMVCI